MDKQLTFAYIAGLSDGDAHIGIKKSVSKQMINPSYSARFQIRMVNEEVIRFIAETFGGVYKQEKARAKNGKPLFCFAVTDKKAEAILREIHPYLITKKRVSELVMELARLKSDSSKYRTKEVLCEWTDSLGRKIRTTRTALSDEYIAKCEELYQACKKFNSEPNESDYHFPFEDEKVKLAYIAGLIDAEGTMGIRHHNRKDAVSTLYTPTICLAMVDKPSIQFVADTLGGSFRREKPQKDHLKPLYRYLIHSKRAGEAIEKILPYLIVKKEVAEVLLELAKMKMNHTKYKTKIVGYRNFPNMYGTERIVPTYAYSDEFIEKCEELLNRCRELNSTGISSA